MAKSRVLSNIYKAKWCAAHHLKFISKYYMLKIRFYLTVKYIMKRKFPNQQDCHITVWAL